MDIVEELRAKKSRDNKNLYERAASEIERLRKTKIVYETVDYCAADLVKAQTENKELRVEIAGLKTTIQELLQEISKS